MKKLSIRTSAVGVAFLLVAAVAASAVPSLGPDGHYYDIIADPGVDWATANTLANGMSYLGQPGHLVTITSAAEDSFVFNLIGNTGEAWAGGFQSPSNETIPTAGWTWVNGEGTFPGSSSASPYANWQGGEPNDYYGAVLPEQWLGLGLGGNPGWNDEGNLNLITGYAVEFEGTQTKNVPDGAPGLAGVLTIIGLLAAQRRMMKV
jgi:hypothetical protein